MITATIFLWYLFLFLIVWYYENWLPRMHFQRIRTRRSRNRCQVKSCFGTFKNKSSFVRFTNLMTENVRWTSDNIRSVYTYPWFFRQDLSSAQKSERQPSAGTPSVRSSFSARGSSLSHFVFIRFYFMNMRNTKSFVWMSI